MSEQFSGRVDIIDSQGRKVFSFDAQFAVLDLGAVGNEGDLRLRGDDGETKIHLDGGRELVIVTNSGGTTVFRFDAQHASLDLGPSLGGNGAEADLRIFGSDGRSKIHLDGNTGDVFFTLGGESVSSLRNALLDLAGRMSSLELRVRLLEQQT